MNEVKGPYQCDVCGVKLCSETEGDLEDILQTWQLFTIENEHGSVDILVCESCIEDRGPATSFTQYMNRVKAGHHLGFH